jgi:hypothetical protein
MRPRERAANGLFIAERLIAHGRENVHRVHAHVRRDAPEHSSHRRQLYWVLGSNADNAKRAERGCTKG